MSALNEEQFGYTAEQSGFDPYAQYTQAQQPEPPPVGAFRRSPGHGPEMAIPKPRFGGPTADAQNFALATYLRPQAGHPGGPRVPSFESPQDVLGYTAEAIRGMETQAAAARAAQTASTLRYDPALGGLADVAGDLL
jgi:hypothetical protein